MMPHTQGKGYAVVGADLGSRRELREKLCQLVEFDQSEMQHRDQFDTVAGRDVCKPQPGRGQ
jgi:hypothetical protein